MITGLSLTDSEVGWLLLLESSEGTWRPMTVPIWGQYRGNGVLEEPQEGANQELILSSIDTLIHKGQLTIDWEKLGLDSYEVDCLEIFIGALACNELNQADAIHLEGKRLSFAICSAHVLATLMTEGTQNLPSSTSLKSLPEKVLGESEVIRDFYQSFRQLPFQLQLRFGMSLANLYALQAELSTRNIGWQPPEDTFPIDDAQSLQWLAEALQHFEKDELMMNALADQTSSQQQDVDSLVEE